MQQSNVSTRNYSLDMLKFLLSFVIVIHHSPAPFQDFIQPLTTCAVPTFFMISGYLIFSREITTQRIMRNAKRILSIFGGGNYSVLHLVVDQTFRTLYPHSQRYIVIRVCKQRTIQWAFVVSSSLCLCFILNCLFVVKGKTYVV